MAIAEVAAISAASSLQTVDNVWLHKFQFVIFLKNAGVGTKARKNVREERSNLWQLRWAEAKP